MKIIKISVGVLSFGLCFFLWLFWYTANAQAIKRCEMNPEQCRAAYCSQCLTDFDCETFCNK